MSVNTMNLYEAANSHDLQIETVPQIHLLTSLGLKQGTKVKIQNRYRLGGPILLRVEDAFAVALGKDVATQITVTPLNI